MAKSFLEDTQYQIPHDSRGLMHQRSREGLFTGERNLVSLSARPFFPQSLWPLASLHYSYVCTRVSFQTVNSSKSETVYITNSCPSSRCKSKGGTRKRDSKLELAYYYLAIYLEPYFLCTLAFNDNKIIITFKKT